MENWAGNLTYRAAELQEPRTLEELRGVVAGAGRVRVLGSRHSFNDVADGDVLVSVAGLPEDVAVDREAMTVTFGAGMTYGALAAVLRDEDLALHNMASLPHISVAGAVATATHGSGDRSGNLATAVAALELLTSDGELRRVARGDADFDGMVVGLGALGAVTRVTLDVEPAYEVRQRVFEHLDWDTLTSRYDEVTASGESVSVFTTWGDGAGTVWVKSRVTDVVEAIRPDLFGAPAATVERHPIPELDPSNATPQLGVPGPWSERLSHFKMGFTPSTGEELQSEYLLPRERAPEAIEALRAIAAEVRPLLQISELRTVAADSLWMSPQHERDTVGVHFTWVRDTPAVERVLERVEGVLLPLDARPHWGKLFRASPADRYPRTADFLALADRLDPRGAFRNPWFERVFRGAGSTAPHPTRGPGAPSAPA